MSLGDARKAVASRRDLDRLLALLDTWGFESPTQFLVVAILFQDWPIPPYNCIVDKTDGMVYTTTRKTRKCLSILGKTVFGL